MSSASLAKFPDVLVRDFQDGLDIDQVLLVRGAEARSKRDGGEFLRLTLADRTGSVVAMVWEDVERVRVLCPAGAPIQVRGRYRVHPRYGAQIDLVGLREPEPGTFNPAELFDGPPRGAEQRCDGRIRIAVQGDVPVAPRLRRGPFDDLVDVLLLA